MAIKYRRSDPAPPPKPTPEPAHSVERGRGRPPSGKEIVTMRLDVDLLAYYRAKGRGWQATLNDDIKAHLRERGIL